MQLTTQNGADHDEGKAGSVFNAPSACDKPPPLAVSTRPIGSFKFTLVCLPRRVMLRLPYFRALVFLMIIISRLQIVGKKVVDSDCIMVCLISGYSILKHLINRVA